MIFALKGKGLTTVAVASCVAVGGLDDGGTTPKDTRTEAQKATLRKLIEQLHQRYPKALIVGHHDLNPQKACPCFHVTAEYIDLQP